MQWIDDDTLQQILSASISTPSSFASACRVNKAWRRVCTRDDSLLLKCATSRPYITKRDLVGLFALSNNEAESLPREISIRTGRLVYKYNPSVAKDALAVVGGVPKWRRRLERRAVSEAQVERAFGRDWRHWWRSV